MNSVIQKHNRNSQDDDAVTKMEEDIKELSEKIDDHEKRIGELERYLQPKDSTKQVAITKTDVVDVVTSFSSFDISEYEYIYDLSGLSLYLAILLIARENLSVDGLTPTEISKVCREKIRVSTGIDRTTVSNALREAEALVDRIDNPRGRGYAYRIMRRGEIYIQEQIDNI